MKPEQADEALGIMRDEALKLCSEVDADMLGKVKELMLKRVDDSVKQNAYWSGKIHRWYKYGSDEHTNLKATIQAQTPEKISAFVKELLSAGNCITVMMTPEEE